MAERDLCYQLTEIAGHETARGMLGIDELSAFFGVFL